MIVSYIYFNLPFLVHKTCYQLMMNYQKKLIDIISQHVPEGEKLVDFLSQLICLGKEASYRRIRGEVEFTLSEIVTITKQLNINLTSLIISDGGEKVVFNLRLYNENNPINNYIKYLEGNLTIFEGFPNKEETTYYTVNRSIPYLLTFDYQYLKKLEYLKSQFNQGLGQPIPLSHITLPTSLFRIQDKYWNIINQFQLICILDPNMLTSLINDILFFFKLGLISEGEKLIMKDEIKQILEDINESTRTGLYKEKKISFYVSHVTLDLSHSLIVSKELDVSIINLHYPNSLVSFDQQMSQAHLKRLYTIKKCSSLITESGELDKTAFLNRQYEKLNFL